METLILIGHILFGGYFFLMGLNHFLKLESLSAYASSKNVPSPKLAVLASGALILLGGLGIVAGYRLDISAALIVMFLIPVTLKMHDFWNAKDDPTRMSDMQHFLKNTALLGAALLILASGL